MNPQILFVSPAAAARIKGKSETKSFDDPEEHTMKSMSEAAKVIGGLVIFVGLASAFVIGVQAIYKISRAAANKALEAGGEKAREIGGQLAPKLREAAEWLEEKAKKEDPVAFSRRNVDLFPPKPARPSELLSVNSSAVDLLNAKASLFEPQNARPLWLRDVNRRSPLLDSIYARPASSDVPPYLSKRLTERLRSDAPGNAAARLLEERSRKP